MTIERWNKIMDSFIDLLGFDEGVQVTVDTKNGMFAEQRVYELDYKEDRRLIYRLRRLYENLKTEKEDTKGDA